VTEKPGDTIGRYKLREKAGEGGCGVVYVAEQEEPIRRRVALKVIKLGMDTQSVVARFEAERQALALMDHPNIARVLDAGATETGRPFFVMELVRGIKITDYCDQHNLSTRERLDLCMQVCHAVQHAHQKGIIHRDLKPSNILVTLHDGVPVPKVIDFGIAKATEGRLTDLTVYTQLREFIGTPAYMSPEQAEMSGLDIDTRSDMYSLGVLLYELLTGETPFDTKELMQSGLDAMRRTIREKEPLRPSTRLSTMINADLTGVARHHGAEPPVLIGLLRGDLDWIVMKAMEKDRTRRYQTASDLGADLRRHLDNQPVMAGPPSLTYKLGKFVRRNRAAVGLAAVVLAFLMIGLVREIMHYYQAIAERDAAQESEARAVAALSQADKEAVRSQRIADFLQDMLASTDPSQAIGLDVDVDAVVTTAREVFGDDHATVAATLGSLAVQLQGTGNLAAAEPLHRESLGIWKRLHGDKHVNVGIALSRLGTLLRIKGDDLEAESALRESLAISDSVPGPPSVAVSVTLIELADVLAKRGESDESEALLRKAILIQREASPHQRFQIALSMNLLVRSLLVSGKHEEATAAARQAMAEWRKALPERSPSIATLAVQFASMHLQQGNLDEAEALYTEVLDIYRSSEQRPIVYIKGAIRGMVAIQNRRDDKSLEFIPVRMKLVRTARELCGTNEPFLGEVLVDHADYLSHRDRTAEAIRMGIEGLTILQATDPENSMVAKALSRLQDSAWKTAIDPLRSVGDYTAARHAIELCLSENPDNFAAVNTLGTLRYRLGEYEEALETLTRSDAHYSAEQDGGAPHNVAFIAMVHDRLGHNLEAAAELARLRKFMARPDFVSDPESQKSLVEAESLIDGKSEPLSTRKPTPGE